MIVEPRYCATEQCGKLLAAPFDAADDPIPPFCDACLTLMLRLESMADKPYIEIEQVITVRLFNPKYGDEKVCKCGHVYYRHFDTYEDMKPVGCKYCGCFTFTEGN